MVVNDKNIIPKLCYDSMFKATLAKCPKVLLQLVNDILREEFDYDIDSIEIKNNQIEIDSINEKKLTCDLVMLINNKYLVNIEVNKGKYLGLYQRNFVYLNKLFSSLFKKGMTYKEFSKYKVVQINLNLFHQDNMEIMTEQMICNLNDLSVASDILKIIQLDIVKSSDLVYTKDIKEIPKAIRWASIFNETSLEGISNILGEDMLEMEDKKDLLDRINKAKESNDAWKEVEMEGDYEAIVGSYLEMGLEEGLEKGIEQEKIKIIKAMLENNADYDFISKTTGKTIGEIKEIEKQ